MRMLLGIVLLALAAPALARDDKPPVAEAPEKVKAGDTALLTSRKGMRYFLRVPKKYDAKKGARLVVFLHGSNMKGLDYLRSFEAMNWADDALLCCPNGEQGEDPFGANNFTFGSAPFVAEITEELQKTFKTTVTYVGGHSQGGFLTYSVITQFPELYDGAIPMAGDCWMQNEPNLWEKEPKIAAAQREVAIAVIHGRDDPVVDFSQGEHGYDCFRAAGWTKLRLFAPNNIGHMFMASPVGDALEWLDAMNGLEEKKSLDLAAKWAKADEWGWALHAARASKSGGAKLVKDAEAAATKAVAQMSKALDGHPKEWVPQWLEFSRVFGACEAAQPLVKKYAKKRDDQRNDGERLFELANGFFRSDADDKAYEKLDELLEKAPYTYQAFYAVQWLAKRK